MGFADPAKASGAKDEKLAAFRHVRDEIRRQMDAFFRDEWNAYTEGDSA